MHILRHVQYFRNRKFQGVYRISERLGGVWVSVISLYIYIYIYIYVYIDIDIDIDIYIDIYIDI